MTCGFSRPTCSRSVQWLYISLLLCATAACMMSAVCTGWSTNSQSVQHQAFMVTEYSAPAPGTDSTYGLCWYLGLQAGCVTPCPDNTVAPPASPDTTLLQACQPVEAYSTLLALCGAQVTVGGEQPSADLCESMSTCNTSGQVTLAFAVISVLFAVLAAACIGLRLWHHNKFLAKKYSLICSGLAFVCTCVSCVCPVCVSCVCVLCVCPVCMSCVCVLCVCPVCVSCVFPVCVLCVFCVYLSLV